MAAPELRRSDGGVVVSAAGYRLDASRDGPYVRLEDGEGQPWADLALTWSVHALGVRDETFRVRGPAVDRTEGAIRLTWQAGSTAWRRKRIVFECRPDDVRAWAEVQGRGRLDDVCLFGGYSSATPRAGTGWYASAGHFRSLFTPEPGPVERFVLPAGRAAAVDVVGGSYAGRGHWFFTPAPFCLAFGRNEPGDPARASGAPSADAAPVLPGPWLTAGLVARDGERTFTGLHLDVSEEAFWLRLPYEGHTAVEGAFSTPAIAFIPGADDPYDGIARYREVLQAEGLVEPLGERAVPAWWRGPIFCGWGAQCHAAGATTSRAPELSTQDRYDAFMRILEDHGLRPMTVVIDDKWQRDYGPNEPSPDRWPDLRGWIRRRHGAGQRVLLWLKAWDPEGLPTDECITNAAGIPVAADPGSPAYEATLRGAIRDMLAHDGLDADGFKIDFTAQTPSGPGLRGHGSEWGVELLARLLRIIRDEAKRIKPDALIVTQVPDPQLAALSDMIRLNDALRLSDAPGPRPVVAQMRHRAAIVRAACPSLLIETDDWAMPDLATWRDYLAIKAELGVPSLYYTSHIDRSGEPFEEGDYAAVRELWRRLPAPVMQGNRKHGSKVAVSRPDDRAVESAGGSRPSGASHEEEA